MSYWARDGAAHRDTERVRRDHAESVNWLRKAAEAGHVSAAYELGVSYATGRDGVLRTVDVKDVTDHTHVYRVRGIHVVGIVEHDELPEGMNLDEAIRWLQHAADAGSAAAFPTLTHLILRADINEVQTQAVLQHFSRHADNGNRAAMREMASVHRIGAPFVSADLKAASDWEARAFPRSRDAFDDPAWVDEVVAAARAAQLPSPEFVIETGVVSPRSQLGSLSALEAWWSSVRQEMRNRSGNPAAEQALLRTLNDELNGFVGQRVRWTFRPQMQPQLSKFAELNDGTTVQYVEVRNPARSAGPVGIGTADENGILTGEINIRQLYPVPFTRRAIGLASIMQDGAYDVSGTEAFGPIRLKIGPDIPLDRLSNITRETDLVVTGTVAQAVVLTREAPSLRDRFGEHPTGFDGHFPSFEQTVAQIHEDVYGRQSSLTLVITLCDVKVVRIQ